MFRENYTKLNRDINPICIEKEPLKYFYKLLGHENESEIRIFGDKYQNGKSVFVNNFELLNGYIKQFQDEKQSVYIGIHERKIHSKGNKNVIGGQVIPIDIDSKDFKNQEEYEVYLQKLLKQFQEFDLKYSCRIMSGHGTHFYLRIPRQNSQDLENVLQNFKSFLLNEVGVGFDKSIYNLDRVMRIPETFNFKEKDKPIKCEIIEINEVSDEQISRNFKVVRNYQPKKISKRTKISEQQLEKQEFFHDKIKCVDLLKHFGFDVSKYPTECLIPQPDNGKPHESGTGKNIAWNEEKGLITCFHNGCCGVDGDNVMDKIMFTARMLQSSKNKAINYLKDNFLKNYFDKEEVLSQTTDYTFTFGDTNSKKDTLEEIYDFINENYKVYVSEGTKNPIFWVVKDGKIIEGQRIIENLIDRILRKHSTKELVEKILFRFRTRNMKNVENIADNDPCRILTKNCFVYVKSEDIEVEQITNDSPKWFGIKANYKPEKKLPENIKKIFEGIFDKNLIQQIQEFLGYLLYYSNPAQKVFWLTCPSDRSGSNGKSVVMDIMTSLFYSKDISSATLQQIVEDKFLVSQIIDKPLNVGRDIPSTRIDNSSVFKMLSGEDNLMVQKKYQDGYNAFFRGKCVFSANQIPEFNDKTDSIVRRNFPIEFKYQFLTQKEIDEAPEYKKPFLKIKNTNLKSKNFTEDERSGLLNWCLEGLQRLLQNNFEFTKEPTIKNVREYWEKHVSTVNEFLTDYTQFSLKDKISENEFVLNYTKWCRERGIKKESLSSIRKILRGSSICDLGRINGSYYLKSITWKNPDLIQKEEEKDEISKIIELNNDNIEKEITRK